MIHSMSGGIIKDVGTYTFVKIVFDDDENKTPYWYISDFAVEVGDSVSAPRGKADMVAIATVVKVETNVNGQVTPIPLRSAKKLIARRITADDED